MRLWVDRLTTFATLCPDVNPNAQTQRIGDVEVCHWRDDFPDVQPSDIPDVVIEAFACELPATYVAAMSRRELPPKWINLEYLSAESWVEGCHKLPSPTSGLPLTKHFFFPGVTPLTGGLIRERGLLEARAAFDEAAAERFLASLGISPRAEQELFVSLFCYENPQLPALLQCWEEGGEPLRLLVTAGAAATQVQEWFGHPFETGTSMQRGNLTAHALPFLSHDDYDRLLWTCDINFVRGEDSFVRAQWAQRPFVWQIYPQEDNAHRVKLEAFLIRYLEGCDTKVSLTQFWNAWNTQSTPSAEAQSAWLSLMADRQNLDRHARVWAGRLDRAGDLANNLVCFARELQ